MAASAAVGEITGTVFHDRNANGSFDVGDEAGIEGVTVSAFGVDNFPAGSTTTNANGEYTLSFDTEDALTEVRIEFGTPEGYAPTRAGIAGATAGSTVQFAAAGDTADVGFVIPGQPVTDNPPLVWTEQRAQVTGPEGGDWIDPAEQPSIRSMSYDQRGNYLDDEVTEATMAQTGSIWGLANLGDEFVATSALFKRHVATGPGGLGAIYLTEIGGVPDAAPFVTIPNAGTDPRPLVDDADIQDYDWFHDGAGFDGAGVLGLGGLSSSDAFDALYVVNLNDKQLYRVGVDMSGGTPTAGVVEAIADLGMLPGATCDADLVRPYGVEVTGDSVWVTTTCTGPTTDDLAGFVYEFTLDGGLVGGAPVLEFSLDYERGVGFGPAPVPSANWNPWTNDHDEIWFETDDDWKFGVAYPQPLLSDIGMDRNGDLTIGIKDRFGDQSGYLTGHPSGSDDLYNDLYNGTASGDLLRACIVDGAFVLENAGECGGVTGWNPASGEGPGGGEYYDDEFTPPGLGRHAQVGLGAVLQVPGFTDFVATAFDPGDRVWTNGFRFFENATGEYGGSEGTGWTAVAASEFDGSNTENGSMGKGSGLGDLSALVAEQIEIGNRVWIDENRDGIQDPDEVSVEGVEVTLTCGNTVATTTTNADGEYFFNDENVDGGLVANIECTVTFDTTGTIAEGLELTVAEAGDNVAIDSDAVDVDGVATITLITPTSGADHTFDVGFLPHLCSIGDYVWFDLNSNGLQDGGEPGVADVIVTLLDQDGEPVEGVEPFVTGEDGFYEFTGLTCGTYRVSFEDPEGRNFTTQYADDNVDSEIDSNVNPETGVTDEVVLGGDEPIDNPTIDAGLVPFCSVGDYVWFDLNSNGVQDEGEPGVADVIVTLLDANGEPVEGVEPFVTGEDGFYEFTGLTCGTYRVLFEDPEGRNFTTQYADDNVDSEIDSNVNPETGVTDEVVLGGDEPIDNPTIDAGLVPFCSVGDYVWLDLNRDGVQDAGEPGVAGVIVTLLDQDGEPVEGVEPVVTGEDGFYEFTGLECGAYVVSFEDPEGREFTEQYADDNVDSEIDSNVNPETGVTDEVVLGGDEPADNPTVDAGLLPVVEVCSVGDYVWLDLNRDGVQDAGEPGVAGVVVTLLDANGEPVEGVEPFVTGEDGFYEFTGLECGAYVVSFEDPEGREFTEQYADDNVDSEIDSNVNPETGVTDEVVLGGDEPADNPTVDAGLLPVVEVCSVGDFVWLDENGNGVQDQGEPGVAGVIVTLLDSEGNAVDSVVTDDAGFYEFSGLECGAYVVSFEDPEGREFTEQYADDNVDSEIDSNVNPETGVTDEVVLGGDEPADNPTVDAGLLPVVELCSVGDFVWLDENGNGVQDQGEPGVAGVIVTLLDSEGNAVDSVVTDDAGFYEFSGLECGAYVVSFEDPEGREFTEQYADDNVDSEIDSNVNPETGVTDEVVLGGDEPADNPTVDAGLLPVVEVCSVGDYVWLDLNRDGVQDAGEPGVAGVIVTLLDQDGEPVEGVEPVVTGEDGFYEFSGLECGAYVVSFEDPEGREFTTQYADDNVDSEIDSNVNPETGVTDEVVLGGDEPADNPTVDAGLLPVVEVCSVGDFVWLDENGNGVQDQGEPGVAGVIVTLLDSEGNAVDSVVTDDAGFYEFSGLECGAYVVSFEDPEGREFTTQYADDNVDSEIDSNVNPETGVTDEVVLGGDEPADNPTVDAGLLPVVEVCSVGDYVWLDLNRDGVQDAGEPGVAGVVVTLLDANGEPVEGVEPFVTGEDGFYEFSGLECGAYVVSFEDPEGREFTTQYADDNVDSEIDSNVNPETGVTDEVVLGGDEPADNPTVDAGLLPVVEVCSVGDFVWLDENGNGVQDQGEPGVAGVIVTLLDSEGNAVDSVVTDDAGFYEFSGLECGAYVVSFEDPEGREFTTQYADDNVDSEIDSNVNPETGVTDEVVLGGDEPADNPTVDAGLLPVVELCSVGDFVWLDENGNGVQDQGEPGVAGVIVTLLDSEGNAVDSVVTDDAGFYEFSGLECGAYVVSFEDPEGREFTEQYADDNVDSEIDSNVNPETGVTDEVVLGGDEPADNPTVDAGLLPVVEVCSVGDYVWLDLNRDGVQDAGEPGVAGVVVTLLDANGEPVEGVEPFVTGEDGFYEFTGLECGAYVVSFEDPEGREFTEQYADDNVDSEIDSNVNPETGVTDEVVLGGDEPADNPTVDAGLLPVVEVCSVGDYVWLDLNRDGVQDAGEPGVAGVVVTLLDANGEPVEGVEPFVTGEDGFYEFSGLECGAYVVSFEDPEGREFTEQYADDNVDSEIDSNVNPETGVTDEVVLGGDEPADNPTVDAGLLPVLPAELCTVGDFVWLDENGNAIQDNGEPGVADVLVELLDMDGNVVASTVTDASGHYLFEDVECTQYQVRFTSPEGYEFTEPEYGNDDTVDSNAVPTTQNPRVGVTAVFEVTPENPVDLTIDAGLLVVEDDDLAPTGYDGNGILMGGALGALLLMAGAAFLVVRNRAQRA
nr:SdrD B-like domain-containing protein [Microbacterium amylolyticum]